MRKFKTGNDIVRANNYRSYTPKGYKTKVLDGYLFRDNEGDIVNITDKCWELAEDQTTATIKTDNSTVIASLNDRIAELEKSRKSLIEEFAEAECLGEVAQIARGYGYDKNK